MMTPKERYEHDPVFHQLVDLLRHYLEENACRQYTPTELREAVILAASMYDFLHIRPMIMTDRELWDRNLMGSWDAKKRDRVRIMAGWDQAGKLGHRLGADILVGGQTWTPVLWDGEEDPDWHKAAGLNTEW